VLLYGVFYEKYSYFICTLCGSFFSIHLKMKRFYRQSSVASSQQPVVSSQQSVKPNPVTDPRPLIPVPFVLTRNPTPFPKEKGTRGFPLIPS
jgi:hypothetical protein